jgi:hypothetical protein
VAAVCRDRVRPDQHQYRHHGRTRQSQGHRPDQGKGDHRLPQEERSVQVGRRPGKRSRNRPGGIEIPGSAICATVADGFTPPQHARQANPQAQRIYPWGDAWDPERANAEHDIGQTTTPGCFLHGRSPLGCQDMAGNVWEWTRSLWGKHWEKPDFGYPYYAHDSTRENLAARSDILQVVRGGSWPIHRDHARCAFRNRTRPRYWNVYGGFRVLLRRSPVS